MQGVGSYEKGFVKFMRKGHRCTMVNEVLMLLQFKVETLLPWLSTV